MSSEQKPLVPELRFPEFEGQWNKETLGSLMTFKNGVNADKNAYGNGTKFINVLDIIRPEPITHSNIIGSVAISEKDIAKNEVKFGDILFQRSSETREEVGQSNIYVDPKRSAVFGGFVIRGRPTRKLCPHFFDALLRTDSVRKDITSRSGGSTRYNVGQESLSAVEVVFPSVAEQQKIASFLDTVSKKIELLNQKKAALEDYKRGLMQQLFSGTLRFTRPDGSAFPDWEDIELGELLKYQQPSKYLVKNVDYSDEFETPVLTAGKTFILGYTSEKDGIFSKNLPVIIFDDFTTDSKFVDFAFKAKSSAMKILEPRSSGIRLRLIFELMKLIQYKPRLC